MVTKTAQSSTPCHIVAVPYPGRGQINPMMNLCKLVASRQDDILITFVVTEEWHGFICSDPNLNSNISFGTIPNVLPSESERGSNHSGFFEAVMTKMEAPFEQVIDQLQPPVTTIITDALLTWAILGGNSRNIPVAALWTTSTSFFSMLYHFDLFTEERVPFDLSEHAEDRVDFIPGISSIRVADIPNVFSGNNKGLSRLVSSLCKAQYLLSSSIYELEALAFDVLKAKLNFPVYSVGPLIPYFELKCKDSAASNYEDPDYIKWLKIQPASSVLYVSMGSFLSVSSAQMDEIVAGVKSSGVRYLMVARGETSRLKDGCGDLGLVVPWCDQLRVLSHSSIGGFLTHCGWNSCTEAAFAGVPVLTFPIVWDQIPNSKQIVEDWKTGLRLKREFLSDKLVTREEIAKLAKTIMDNNSCERKELSKRALEVREICHGAIAKWGSSDTSLDAFIKDISQGQAI